MKKNFLKIMSVASFVSTQLLGPQAIRAQVVPAHPTADNQWSRTQPNEAPPEVKMAGLTPRSGGLSPLSNDVYFNYQWALKNEGQSYTAKIGNLFFEAPILSNPQIQIGWENFDSQMKKEIKVGVLDSGMYSTKGGPDDLKENLDLASGKDFVVKNGKTFDDRIGHGTHVAGIIAAKINNSLGIAGVTNKVKIIPLRVYDVRQESQAKDDETKVDETRTSNSVTPRIIEAMKYAIEKKLDVLNLSLGWPKKEDSKEIREIFQKAAEAGITIVAASGNDGNNLQLYPCAYKQVICVGSISMDGSTSTFSNYGNHVDLLAPGQGILSLIPPTENIISNVFGVRGYEIKNGTSQATPFVTAAAAILKGIYPEESPEDIKNRLLLGAIKINNSSQFGLINIKNSVELKSKEIAYANSKSIDDAVVDAKTMTFEFPLNVYSNLSTPPQVDVISGTDGIQITNIQKKEQNGKEILYAISAKVDSLKASNIFDYKVKVNNRTFDASIVLKQNLESLSKQKLEVTNNEAALKIGFLPVTVVSPNDSKKIEFWSFLPNKEKKNFKLQVWSQENQQLVDRSMTIENADGPFSAFNLVRDDFDFDGNQEYLLFVTRNGGTKNLDIEAIYLDSKLNEKYRLLVERDAKDKSGNAVYSILPQFRSVRDIAFAKIQLGHSNKFLKVPLFRGATASPKVDTMERFAVQNDAKIALKAPVSSEDFNAAKGLPITELNPARDQYFYYEPISAEANQQKLRLRSLTSSVAEQTVRRLLYEKKVKTLLLDGRFKSLVQEKDLSAALQDDQLAQYLIRAKINGLMTQDERNQIFDADVDQDLKFIGVLPQSNDTSRTGEVQVLASFGRGLQKIYYRIIFNNLSLRYAGAAIQGFKLNAIDLERNNVKEITKLSRGQVDSESGFSALYSWTGGTSLVLRDRQVGGQNIVIEDRREALAEILKTFTKDSDMLDIFETTKFIRMKGTWNRKAIDEKSIVYRTSFLPGHSFSEMFQPVIVSEKQNPGVMIDSSDIFSNRLSIYTLDTDGKMRSSIERSIEIPKFCKAKRTPFLNEKGFSTIAIVCGEKIEVPGGEPQFKVFVELLDLN